MTSSTRWLLNNFWAQMILGPLLLFGGALLIATAQQNGTVLSTRDTIRDGAMVGVGILLTINGLLHWPKRATSKPTPPSL